MITVFYEELVQNPNKVQDALENQISFLERTSEFSDFHKVASPSKDSVAALGGVRKITVSSIGNWRNHLPRVKAQIELYGDISEDLIRFGYERDESWLDELAAVQADNGPPRPGLRPQLVRANIQRIERAIKLARYRLGIPRRKKVIVNN